MFAAISAERVPPRGTFFPTLRPSVFTGGAITWPSPRDANRYRDRVDSGLDCREPVDETTNAGPNSASCGSPTGS